METEHAFLNIERGGHRLILDRRGDYYRVHCNGGNQAQFCAATMGDVAALKAAILFAADLEADCLKFPKQKD